MTSTGIPSQAKEPRSSYSKRRALVLTLVVLAMTGHLIHGLVAEKTLAPLELNEVMHTLELGIVTAGFLFMCVVLLSVLLFGRFFCSWACHILALEDAAAWLLARIRIHPRPIRSRLLLLVAPLAFLYMFVWPQLKRLTTWLWPDTADFLNPPPPFELRVLTDDDGWASFITNDFTRNLPGPGIAVLTFAVCGFLIVYLLGSRSFCRYACPYGALFSAANRLSPGQILSTTNCTGCQTCTRNCSTGVIVHEEIDRFGKIVSPNCLKDFDCISVCSTGTLQYGFAAPSLLASTSRKGRTTVDYSFTWREEALMAVLFLISFAIFRGLYDLLPFLLSLGLAACTAYTGVIALRLFTRPTFQHFKSHLKTRGVMQRSGWFFALGCVLAAGVVIHCGIVRYHEVMGERRFETASNAWQTTGKIPDNTLRLALAHQTARANWGIIIPQDIAAKQATLLQAAGRHAEAIPHLLEQLRSEPDNEQTVFNLATALAIARRIPEAIDVLEGLIADHPTNAAAHYNLARLQVQLQRFSPAVSNFRTALALQPGDPETLNNLGLLLAHLNQIPEALTLLRQSIKASPDYAEPHFNLARILDATGHKDEAKAHFLRAAHLNPQFAPQTPKQTH